MLPEYISAENGIKYVPFTGNILFLKSILYEHNNFPIRLLLEEEQLSAFIIVYVTAKNLICVDTSSEGKLFESILKIPVSTLKERVFEGINYEIYNFKSKINHRNFKIQIIKSI